MGQYWQGAAFKDGYLIRTCVRPGHLKLIEHSRIGSIDTAPIHNIIENKPCNVAWIGDYSTTPYDGSEPYQRKFPKKKFAEIYDEVWNRDASKFVGSLGISYYAGFLINHSKQRYIDLSDYEEVDPLPLLTACGNDRGGGDYHGPLEKRIGTWAFDELEFSKSYNGPYKKVFYAFEFC